MGSEKQVKPYCSPQWWDGAVCGVSSEGLLLSSETCLTLVQVLWWLWDRVKQTHQCLCLSALLFLLLLILLLLFVWLWITLCSLWRLVHKQTEAFSIRIINVLKPLRRPHSWSARWWWCWWWWQVLHMQGDSGECDGGWGDGGSWCFYPAWLFVS